MDEVKSNMKDLTEAVSALAGLQERTLKRLINVEESVQSSGKFASALAGAEGRKPIAQGYDPFSSPLSFAFN